MAERIFNIGKMGGGGIVEELKEIIVDCHTKKWVSYITQTGTGMPLQLKLYKIERP